MALYYYNKQKTESKPKVKERNVFECTVQIIYKTKLKIRSRGAIVVVFVW